MAVCAVLVASGASAQDRNKARAEAKSAAAGLRALGEPKDRCATGAELQGENVVVRASRGSSLLPGDRLESLNGQDVTHGDIAATIGILRSVAPGATIPATVRRGQARTEVSIVCTNSRPIMEAYVAGLDQAAAGKFDDCAATFGRPLDFGAGGALARARCLALGRKPDARVVAEAEFVALRMAIEDATYMPPSRRRLAQQLRVSEASMSQQVGAARFQELVALTMRWPGDADLFARSEPDWAAFRRKGEEVLRARLVDPESARIEWPRGFLYGSWKPILSKRIEGYWTCGLVNARNRMGGYTGSTAFVVVMDPDGNVLFSDMGSAREYDLVSSQCTGSANMLPPAPPQLQASATPPGEPARQGSLGDELRKLAELKAAGALTDGEFQAAKAKLLGETGR
ncbi:SHOCT domain-containing protein [Sphingomonas sp. BK069]|uniref:SHOCT domain-containing protein n=1 Tax=Sphingomonas sp. BK069 TaxID=2586979 RepID=UPI0017CBCDD7|nr:SHOCT domain-containing protein [Sphingomonas sp. BK069]MBB3348340.1 hypothetical protein [Sphingomonas sp. BK069]